MNPKLPFVFVNMAITADGKIATANRAVSSFGSHRDYDHLLELRATAAGPQRYYRLRYP